MKLSLRDYIRQIFHIPFFSKRLLEGDKIRIYNIFCENVNFIVNLNISKFTALEFTYSLNTNGRSLLSSLKF